MVQLIEYSGVLDNMAWGDGPWKTEPDKVQWQDVKTGLPCLIVRNWMGALCGYVGVPEGHRYYGQPYDGLDVDVHGGLTFASGCQKGAPEHHGVCHIPEEGESDNVWWLGFDCAHFMDLVPSMREFLNEPSAVYRDIEWVKAEVAHLAEQLVE